MEKNGTMKRGIDLENLYTVKELSQKYNVSEKVIYSNLKSNDTLKDNIIYKGKKTYLNEEGSNILGDILFKEIEEEKTEEVEEVLEEVNKIQVEESEIESKNEVENIESLKSEYDISYENIKDSIVDKTSGEEAVSILLAQLKEKDNLIKRLVSLIESNQVILEKDREKLLDDTRYYNTLKMLEERAIKFDENIPYLRNKLDGKKNSKKWWKKS